MHGKFSTLVGIRPQHSYLLGEFTDNLGKPRTFSRGNPFQTESLRLNTEILQHQVYRVGPALRLLIPALIVAVADVTSTDQDAVGALRQGVDHQIRMNHAGTHYPYDPYTCRILKTGNTCQIRSRVGAPVAAKSNDERVKVFTHYCTPKAAYT